MRLATGRGEGDAALQAVCSELAAEPLMAASLSSMELFHSNLLGWMAEQFPERAAAVLAPWLNSNAGRSQHVVRREWNRFDLEIELPGYEPLVVEQKTFALPDDDQLRRYSDKSALRDVAAEPSCILLSLIDPQWPDERFVAGGRTWQFVPVTALADRIIAHFVASHDFAHRILVHEAHLLQLLADIMRATTITSEDDEPYELPQSTLKPLRAVRVDAAVRKMRALQTKNLIAAAYSRAGIEPTYEFLAGYSHAAALVSALWSNEQGDGVGWQLQGGGWQLAMILQTLSGRDERARAARAARAAKHEDWFDFAALARAAGTQPGTRRTYPATGFNRYDPDFVYRSQKLPPGITVGQIIDLAMIYGRAAQQWSF